MKNKNILFITISPWNEPKRIRRQLADRLIEDGNKLTYVALPSRRRTPNTSKFLALKDCKVLEITGPALPLQWIRFIPPIFVIYQISIAQKIKKISLPTEYDFCFIFTPLYPRLLNYLDIYDKAIYFLNDDYSSLILDKLKAARSRKDESLLMKGCDAVIAVSQSILNKFSQLNLPKMVLYPWLGIDAPFLLNLHSYPKSAAYFGYIDWRIDFLLIEMMLADGFMITMIGPTIEVESQISKLKRQYPNRFTVLDAMDENLASAELSKFHLLLLPFLYKNQTQAEDVELPNKLLTYLRLGKPVITTWMKNILYADGEIVIRADSRKKFIELANLAIMKDNSLLRARRIEVALKNNWEHRRQQLDNFLESLP